MALGKKILGCGAVAQSVEGPSKVPVWCNSADVGSNHVQRHFISLISQWHKVVGKS